MTWTDPNTGKPIPYWQGYGPPPPQPPAAPPAPSAPTSNPTAPPTDPAAQPNQNALDLVRSQFPWFDTLGLTSQLQQWVVQGKTGDEIVAQVRSTQQYKDRLPGITRDDGSMRMNEAQYFQRETDYRQLLTQYGDPGYAYDKPQDLAFAFKQDIDPNELQQRLQTYDDIKRGSDDTKAAFYVYAGLRPTDDDLYLATVDPSARQQLENDYTAAVAKQTPDYTTFIKRATEVAMDHFGKNLSQLEEQGILPPGTAAGAASGTDPQAASRLVDLLYHGGDPQGPFLNLQELLHSAQYALIGSAATQNGLNLTDPAMVEQMRQAGIDRNRALSVYGQLAKDQSVLQGSLQRAGFSNFTQDDFEKALFLNQGAQTQDLAQAAGHEKALGASTGSASISVDNATGQLRQRGLATNSA